MNRQYTSTSIWNQVKAIKTVRVRLAEWVRICVNTCTARLVTTLCPWGYRKSKIYLFIFTNKMREIDRAKKGYLLR